MLISCTKSIILVLYINFYFLDLFLFDNKKDFTFNSWIIDLNSKLEALGYVDFSISEK